MDDNDPVALYLREVASSPPLSQDEESELLQQSKSRHGAQSELAKRRLIESKLALVVTIAERYALSGIPMLELLQEGNLGLMKAVDTFAENAERSFADHAAALIESAIVSAITQADSA